MKPLTYRVKTYLSLFIVLLMITGNVWGTDDPTHKSIGGVDIFIGIVPAEIIKGRNLAKEMNMHGGNIRGGNLYHLVVALFDTKTRERISEANIKANISVPGSSGSTKKLEKMEINNTVSFGNYYAFPKTAPYYIGLTLDIPGKNVNKAVFTFTSPMK